MASVPTTTTAHLGGSYARLGDQRLASLAGTGDHGAAEAIHSRYADALLAYSRSIVRDPDDAQDVLQQTMLNALQALSRRELQAPLRPWLFRIAHNTSISLLRRRRPTDELREDASATGQGVSAETESLARERLRELVDDVAALPERQRTALLLHDVAGLPHAEVAAELGCTDGASRQTVTAARVALREAAVGREVPCPEVRAILDAGDRRRLRARPIRAHLRTCTGCSLHAVRTTPPSMASQPSGLLGTLLQGLGLATTSVGVPAVAGSMATKAALVLTVAATAAVGGVVEGGVAPPTRHVTARPTLVSAPPSPDAGAATPVAAALRSAAPSLSPSGLSAAAATTTAAAVHHAAGTGKAAAPDEAPAPLSFGGRHHGALHERDSPPPPAALRTAAGIGRPVPGHGSSGSTPWHRPSPFTSADGTGEHRSATHQDRQPASWPAGRHGQRDTQGVASPQSQDAQPAAVSSPPPQHHAPQTTEPASPSVGTGAPEPQATASPAAGPAPSQMPDRDRPRP